MKQADFITNAKEVHAVLSKMTNIEYLIFIKNKKMRLWVYMGIYFGYSKCCIIDFCSRGYKLTKSQKLVHGNSGFVPCDKCCNKIIKNKKGLSSLIKNRICRMPF